MTFDLKGYFSNFIPNNKEVFHVALEDPLVSFVDFPDQGHLDIIDNAVLRAKIEHLTEK